MSTPQPPDLLGQAPVFLDALAHASDAAALDRPLLLIGERGTGKELIAARIHFLSPRWEGPLVKVNCAAMNEELLESELFGHEAGSFTGASKKHLGRFERAEGGTLFLDEIPSASLRVQEKLLRVIEYGEYERVGGEKTLNADVRIVAAANVDLRAQAREGKFRADLLDRLAFDVIVAPPLRERREDIAQLAGSFAARMASEIDQPYDGFTAEAMAQLRAHNWPGNVRELKNAAERSFYRWRASEMPGPVGEIIIDPFPALSAADDLQAEYETAAPVATMAPEIKSAESGDINLRARLDEIEKQLVTEALARNGDNQKRAAKALSLSYDQIRGIVRKYGIGRA
jgi:psp operon transcriptional activator